jgi:hypothetical protein
MTEGRGGRSSISREEIAMRTRAYRPEFSGCLEGRLLLSGVAPYVFPTQKSKLFVAHVVDNFTLYARYHDHNQIHRDLDDTIVIIPFAHADGLPAKVDVIVDRMLEDVLAGVPHAIRTAANDVVAAARAEVEARARAGDVVVR